MFAYSVPESMIIVVVSGQKENLDIIVSLIIVTFLCHLSLASADGQSAKK